MGKGGNLQRITEFWNSYVKSRVYELVYDICIFHIKINTIFEMNRLQTLIIGCIY